MYTLNLNFVYQLWNFIMLLEYNLMNINAGYHEMQESPFKI